MTNGSIQRSTNARLCGELYSDSYFASVFALQLPSLIAWRQKKLGELKGLLLKAGFIYKPAKGSHTK